MSEKLLSIVIPTKDREYYCKRVLDYMLSINDDRIEFVIQNNGLSNELDEYIKEKKDIRIVYKHVYEPLCQVVNSDQSIALSSGMYLCFIGDDDIVFPNIMQYVEYAISNDIDSIAQKHPFNYYWPSEINPKGSLNYWPATDEIEQVTNQHDCLRNFVHEGCSKNPKDFRLPVLYHGITRRMCIENVKKETGHYVGGSSPDSYTSVALAKFIKKQVIINSNYSVFGACPQSATALNLVGGHCGTLDMAPHLKNRGVYEWDPIIPKYYSVQTIWAESAIKALRETHSPLAEHLNLKALFCWAYLCNKSIRKLIIHQTNNSLTENNINKLFFWTTSIFKVIYEKIMMAYKYYVVRPLYVLKGSNVRSITKVMDISDCEKYI